jgi:hypothetical protein
MKNKQTPHIFISLDLLEVLNLNRHLLHVDPDILVVSDHVVGLGLDANVLKQVVRMEQSCWIVAMTPSLMATFSMSL